MRSPASVYAFVMRANRDKAMVDWRMHESIWSDLSQEFGSPEGCRILDVGCGYDYSQSLLFHSRGVAVSGVDIDLHRDRRSWLTPHSWVARLRRRLYYTELRSIVPFPLSFAGLDVRELDIKKLPFPAGTFDAAISNAVFEHLMDVPAALDEIHRVLKPGGLLRLGIHLFTSLSGPHNPRLQQNPVVDWPADLAPWYHLRGLPPAIPAHLNRRREADYLDAIGSRFEIGRCERKLEGEHLLPPALEAELKDYSRPELLTRGLLIYARKP